MKPIPKYIALLLVIIGFYACASTGMPDGGPYDETPPKFVRATPEPNATNNKRKKISIEFDEYIKLDKASEKVIISPPQNEAPEVKVSGHRVLVEFFDTLRENTTYTIDFGDAIVDNNEDNPLGNFAYAFSTGEHIDTMEVSGTVLAAENLEPVKGIQVGLHKNLEDSAFVKLPFDRISRTDSRGRFTIRGVAPGKYRIYALMDGNQNYFFDSKTEAVAFLDSLVVPDMRPAMRQDTVWNELDTLAYDTIYEVHYTRFLPDNLILRSFKEEKERKKRAKKGDTLKVEPKFFAMSVDAPSNLDLNRNIVLKFDEPVEHIDTAAIHMAVKVDSLWEDIPFILMADSVAPRQYQILADWQPGQEYQLKIDSLGIKGIYGLYTNKVENQLKVKTLEDYGTLYLNIVGAGPHAIVQLLNSSDGVVRQQPVTDKNTCDFYFLQPSTKYYIRLFNDDNNNGVWDTGNYAEKRQPEEVFYFPKVWEMKANFEFEETWDIHAMPLDKQKLDEIKKQKPDEAKKIKDRNKERARKLGRT